MDFIELKEFGWNWLTASFLCIAAITLWQYYAFAAQAYKIWRLRSAEAISITQNTFRCFATLASIEYGLISQNLVITLTGGLTIPGLFIMWGAWKFGKPALRDKIVLAISIASTIFFFLPIDPALVFSGFMCVGLIPIYDQVYVLRKDKVRGTLHGGMLLTFVVKNAFLTIFAFAVQDIVYMTFIPVYFALTLWQFLLWYGYGKETETKMQ